MNVNRLIVAILVAAGFLFGSANADAQVISDTQPEFHLFQNQYTQPGASASIAAMYNAPYPVPYWVGHSYYTYQPLYPHQHLYAHHKSYYSSYGSPQDFYHHPCSKRCGGAMTKTTVSWQHGCNHMGYFPGSSYFGQKLKYACDAKGLCLFGKGGGCAGGSCGGGSSCGCK